MISLSWLTYRVLAYIAGGLGVAVVALSVALWAQGVRVGKAQNERDRVQIQLTSALRTIKGQEDALRECTARTAALKAEGEKRAAAADEALSRAQAEARRHADSLKRLRGLQAVSTPSGAGCREAVAEVRKGLRK